MSEKNTIRYKLDPDQPKDLSKETKAQLDALSDEDIERAAAADPDARLLTDDELSRLERRPNPKIIRKALGLTQTEFADSFGIPLRTLQEWEQNRRIPDQPTLSYLRVIAKRPDDVKEALRPL